MTELIFPVAYVVKCRLLEDGQWAMHYEEKFTGSDPEFIDSTVAIFKKAIPSAVVKRDGMTIIIKVTGSREQISDMMVGEFLQTSTLGRIPIGELATRVLASALTG